MYNKQDCLERFYDDSDHHYTREMAQKSAQFFAKHLLDYEIGQIDDNLINAADEKMLYCTKTGQVMTSITGAYTVYDEINIELQKRNSNKEDTLKFLHERINKNRTIIDSYFMKRWLDGMFVDDLHVEGYLWMSQEDIINSGLIFKSKDNIAKKLPVTVAIWSGGSYKLSEYDDFIKKTCGQGRSVIVFDVIGTGLTSQRALNGNDPLSFYGVMFKLNDDLLWLDDSLAALRIHDVIRLLDIIENNGVFDINNLEIYTHGRYSVYADIAIFVDGRIKKVISHEPLISYKDFIKTKFYDRTDIASVILPGLLDYTDFDEM
jgi:hypothetical protein